MFEKVATDVVVKTASSIVGAILKRHLEASHSHVSKIDTEHQLRTHLTLTYNWAHDLQTYGMAAPIDTSTQTIELNIQSEPRKFKAGPHAQSASISEADIIGTADNYIILGDPGSGKTTTIRRLITKMFLPTEVASIYQYPLLVRLRESKHPDHLLREIADIINVPAKPPGSGHGRRKRDSSPDDPAGYLVGTKTLDRFVIDFLNETRAVVFVDGLDELSPANKGKAEQQLSNMALSFTHAKLIVSCRSGGYTRSVEGFHIIEIRALDLEAIKAISARWLGVAEMGNFLKALREHPLFQLADRPLFLMQLLILYRESITASNHMIPLEERSSIPENVAEVYRQVILLALQRWDTQRGVHRKSKYSGFTPDRKLDFLANFAYELFYELKNTTSNFGHDDLHKIYRQIYSSYGLPISEARDVVSEIETHTGIIVESRSDRFEFSHFTLQEYLAAYHIVRNPFPRSLQWYLKNNSPPLAIAVSISSNSSVYFASVILTGERYRYFSEEQLVAFLDRTIIERPFFGVEVMLGIAILRLFFDYEANTKVMSAVTSVLALNNVGQSAVQAMGHYNIGRMDEHRRINFKKLSDYPNDYGLETPEYGSIGVESYNIIMHYQ